MYHKEIDKNMNSLLFFINELSFIFKAPYILCFIDQICFGNTDKLIAESTNKG